MAVAQKHMMGQRKSYLYLPHSPRHTRSQGNAQGTLTNQKPYFGHSDYKGDASLRLKGKKTSICTYPTLKIWS